MVFSENQQQINDLAESLFRVYNPDFALVHPSGSILHRSTSVPDSFSKSSVFSLRSLLTIMAFSQMDVVAS
jgi:hypothetical protein